MSLPSDVADVVRVKELYVGKLFGPAGNGSTSMAVTDDFRIGVGSTTGMRIGTNANQKIGFYNTTPVAQQTGVAVSAAAIHAALVALGLITA